MKRLATPLVMALPAAMFAASSAVAAAPHAAQASDNSHDTVAIIVIAVLGLVIAASALVPLGRGRGSAARA
jgi:hypothetical protein